MRKTFVCRCEDVTLYELERAMERGYKDLESLKRYTGFGTGWCQGKWCQAMVAEVITRRGGDATKPKTPRPPYHPASLASLAGLADDDDAPDHDRAS